MAAPDKSEEAMLVAWLYQWLCHVNGYSYNGAARYLAEILAGTKEKTIVENKTRNIKRQYAKCRHIVEPAFIGDGVRQDVYEHVLLAFQVYLAQQLPRFAKDVAPEIAKTSDADEVRALIKKYLKRRTRLVDAFLAVFPETPK